MSNHPIPMETRRTIAKGLATLLIMMLLCILNSMLWIFGGGVPLTLYAFGVMASLYYLWNLKAYNRACESIGLKGHNSPWTLARAIA